MLVDSHCHLDRLDLTPFDGQLENALNAAREKGVQHFLCVCIDLENFAAIKAIGESYADVDISVGVHPNEQDCHDPSTAELVQLTKSPKVIAIGETGLDYYRTEKDAEWQKTRFKNHILAARETKKPLIVHTRLAREDTIDMLKTIGEGEVRGVLHCFTEDWDMARAAIDIGFYISFSGIVTFKNAVELQTVAKQVPLDRLLVETDSPYLSPVPFRGKPNHPANVYYVAEYLAALRGESFADVCRATTENFYNLFKPE